jgi:hypothetical protein
MWYTVSLLEMGPTTLVVFTSTPKRRGGGGRRGGEGGGEKRERGSERGREEGRRVLLSIATAFHCRRNFDIARGLERYECAIVTTNASSVGISAAVVALRALEGRVMNQIAFNESGRHCNGDRLHFGIIGRGTRGAGGHAPQIFLPMVLVSPDPDIIDCFISIECANK